MQINGANLRAKMEGNRRQSEALLKHGGEQMLARVLLHVVEAARPVDAAVDIRTFRATVDNVNDFVAFIADVEDICIRDLAQVVRLAARSRVKSRTIQNQSPDSGSNSRVYIRRKNFAAHDPRGEFAFESVVVVQAACRHSFIQGTRNAARAARPRYICSR